MAPPAHRRNAGSSAPDTRRTALTLLNRMRALEREQRRLWAGRGNPFRTRSHVRTTVPTQAHARTWAQVHTDNHTFTLALTHPGTHPRMQGNLHVHTRQRAHSRARGHRIIVPQAWYSHTAERHAS